jgi:hypothetical protein
MGEYLSDGEILGKLAAALLLVDMANLSPSLPDSNIAS